jgi:nickel/cobalt transporter (NicO) family protein
VWDRLRAEEGLFDQTFVRLLDDPDTGFAVAAVGLLIAAGVGAVHALGPGHGKALIGAYLAGTRGRASDAVALGVLVAAMHTGSVLLFGFALHTTQQLPTEGALGSLVPFATGLAIAAVGAWMLHQHLRARRGTRQRGVPMPVEVGASAVRSGPADAGVHHPRHPGARSPHPHHDGEAAIHQHDGAVATHHHDLPEGVAPLSRAGVLALASSGGLLPSPAAFLVLVTALAAGRAGYGVALVGAFSVGLAATLTAIGLAVLWGREAFVRAAGRRPGLGRLARLLPGTAATIVLVGGLLLAAGAVAGW